MKRKLMALAMAAAMVIGLTACGSAPASSTASTDTESTSDSASASTDTAADTSASGELIKVGIINNDPNESGYRTANDKDLKAMFTAENGYEASFAYSLKNDEQITAAQKFIQDGVDYLLLSAADTAGWDSVLKDAQDAGIRVILFDRTIDADASLYEASIVSDMAKEGQTAVDWLKGQGLSEYKIIHLQGVMGSAAQQGRSGALDEAVASDGWTLVTQQTAEWNAEKATACAYGENKNLKVSIKGDKIYINSALWNGKEHAIEINGRIYIPLSLVQELYPNVSTNALENEISIYVP